MSSRKVISDQQRLRKGVNIPASGNFHIWIESFRLGPFGGAEAKAEGKGEAKKQLPERRELDVNVSRIQTFK